MKVIPAADAHVGDILLVRVGDRIPLDGVVIDGESLVDTSPVTGEPVPVKRKYGDEVVSISWKPARSTQEAFVDEYMRMAKRGVKNLNTYNKVWSPGRRIYQKRMYDLLK